MKLSALALALGVGAAAGFVGGWAVWHPRPGRLEPAAPEHRQSDSSLVLARTPNPEAKPIAQIPHGGTVERIIRLTVEGPQPTAIPGGGKVPRGTSPTEVDTAPAVICPPMHIELTIERERDGSHRVIAKAPGGEILSGVDIPVTAPPVHKGAPWSAGLRWNALTGKLGGSIGREIGPLRIDLTAIPGVSKNEAVIALGLDFRF